MKKYLYTLLICFLISKLLTAQVTLIEHMNMQDYMTTLNGNIIFFGDSSNNGYYEPWKSDGTIAGSFRIKDINPGNEGVLDEYQWGTKYNLYTPLAYNNYLYFLANDGIHETEVWKTNGTDTGTTMLKDIDPSGSAFFNPYFLWPYFCVYNGLLYFGASDGTHGAELWSTDGTAANTKMVDDISTANYYGSMPSHMTVYNGSLYFTAYDDTFGVELFKSDGTSSGTNVLKHIIKGHQGAFNDGYGESTDPMFTISGSYLYFIARLDSVGAVTYLYRTDGTPGGTINLSSTVYNVSSLTDVNGTLYFYGDDGSGSGSYLYKTDGSVSGTVNVPTNDVVAAYGFYSFKNKLYFLGSNTLQTKWGLAESDGTKPGTSIIYNMPFISSYPQILYYTNNNNSFFCHAELLVSSNSLDWRVMQSNGTAGGNKIFWGATPFGNTSTMYNGDYYFYGEDTTCGGGCFNLYKVKPSALGINQLTVDNGQLKIYPNPTSNQLIIDNGQLTIQKIEIRNVLGETVYSSLDDHLSPLTTIDVSAFSVGMYFVSVTSGESVITKKLIISR